MGKKNRKADDYWDGEFENDMVQEEQVPAAAAAAPASSASSKNKKKKATKKAEEEVEEAEEEVKPAAKSAKNNKKKAAKKVEEEEEEEEEAEEVKPAAKSAKKGKPAAPSKESAPASVSAPVAAKGKKLSAAAKAALKMVELRRQEEERIRAEEEAIRLEEEEEERQRLEEERIKAEKEAAKKEAKKLKDAEKEKKKKEREVDPVLNEKRRLEILSRMPGAILPKALDSTEQKQKKVFYGKKKPAKKQQKQDTKKTDAEKKAGAVVEKKIEESKIEVVADSWEDFDEEDDPIQKIKDLEAVQQREQDRLKKEREEKERKAKEEAEKKQRDAEKKKAAEAERKQKEADRREAERLAQSVPAGVKIAAGDVLRSPICCILGHVDAGKTSLLDKIRRSNVQEGEAGGITQQIGATYFPAIPTLVDQVSKLDASYKVQIPGLLVIDTPGHEAFANLRSRGSSLCDIAIVVLDMFSGIQQQTIESLNLLRKRKTPFIVALNKCDRLFGWKSTPGDPFVKSLLTQNESVKSEFEHHVKHAIVQLAEQEFNAAVYDKNTNVRKNVSIVPTSARTGEGIPDLLSLLVKLTQEIMSKNLLLVGRLDCIVLEVKVVDGHGYTIDVILRDGELKEGDTIVLCGMQGPIVTNIRALLTPHANKEMRVAKGYQHNKSVRGAVGVKIAAPDLEKAVAGTSLLVKGPNTDIEQLKEEAMSDFNSLLKSVDKSGKGVFVQASTLGSLEALLQFLQENKVPVAGINVGPIHRKDIMHASVMVERDRTYAVMLAFDVKIEKDAQHMADDVGVKIFSADVIYHLFDQLTAYFDDLRKEKQTTAAQEAVFPCKLKIYPEYIINKTNPIILGVEVMEGVLKIGSPLCIQNPDGTFSGIGRVTSIEANKKQVETAPRGAQISVKIEPKNDSQKKIYGRHFDHNNVIYSHLSRASLDAIKTYFAEQLTTELIELLFELRDFFDI
eukprot:TRINITY_DN153_c0_g1_i1.p1 TRINITY_DN153_c0_g1~~TRINITY_DN153_c0_g1_i1.p1  ORF type:complete len:961 (-),score=559.34 TRINITY_DN153_c0_g1_i1:13-2895(-)